LSEEESRSFFKQIVRAVHYIHSKKIIHRDLKLENILLDARNQCKIVDFGLSDYVSGKDRTVTDAGTEAYLAPEVYNGFSGDSDPFKIDSWSLGVVLYAMTHGKLPFCRPDLETCAMLDKDGLSFDADVTRSYTKVTKAMLTPCPDKRSSVDIITVDPWVTMHRFAMCNEELPSDAEDEHPVEETIDPRRGSRSYTMPAVYDMSSMAAAAMRESPSPPLAPADRPDRPVPSPRILRERFASDDGHIMPSPRTGTQKRDQRERKDGDRGRMLPSLPAGRGGTAGGAAPSWARARPDVSPGLRRNLRDPAPK